MLSRRADWQQRLQQYLDLSSQACFQYGLFDCCLFVCDAIREMTDFDLAADFRGRYDSAASARAAMFHSVSSHSVRKVAEVITTRNAMPEVAPLLAQRGDVALLCRVRTDSLGLVALNGREILTCERRGLRRLPLASALRVWRV
jgi:hypothetical protein